MVANGETDRLVGGKKEELVEEGNKDSLFEKIPPDAKIGISMQGLTKVFGGCVAVLLRPCPLTLSFPKSGVFFIIDVKAELSAEIRWLDNSSRGQRQHGHQGGRHHSSAGSQRCWQDHHHVFAHWCLCLLPLIVIAKGARNTHVCAA